jgi:hypothetical protein
MAHQTLGKFKSNLHIPHLSSKNCFIKLSRLSLRTFALSQNTSLPKGNDEISK